MRLSNERRRNNLPNWFLAAAIGLTTPALAAQEEDLAKQLANPVAALISVPFQYNYDEKIGADQDGKKNYINLQPVVPITLNHDWNLISRTILPIVDQHDIPAIGDHQSGIGDVTQSLFFSPAKPTATGLIWGAGPVFLLPTASNDQLGNGKWGLGPTFVALKQDGPWTYGILANHIWSVAGASQRADVSATFLQPFLAYITRTKTTLSINTESTYDWEAKQWSVPLNLVVSQLLKVGDQPLQIGVGARYWADHPESGPRGWGVRFVLTLLFPK